VRIPPDGGGGVTAQKFGVARKALEIDNDSAKFEGPAVGRDEGLQRHFARGSRRDVIPGSLVIVSLAGWRSSQLVAAVETIIFGVPRSVSSRSSSRATFRPRSTV
jgi:hypothetical protein